MGWPMGGVENEDGGKVVISMCSGSVELRRTSMGGGSCFCIMLGSASTSTSQKGTDVATNHEYFALFLSPGALQKQHFSIPKLP